MALPPLPAPRPRRLLRAACYRGRPRARCALLSALAALLSLSAGAWLGCGGHEELLSRALLPLLPGPPPEPPGAPPLLPGADAFVLEPAACPCAAPTAPPARAPFLLVLVASAPGHGERRRAARESWAGPRWASGLPVRTVFAVGLPAEPGAQAALEREAARHGDLLQGRFLDAYRNLTLKTLAMLGWAATRCPAAAFVLKTDDDVFLNLPALAAQLRDEQRRGLGGGGAAAASYLGRVHWWVRPERDPRSRHHVPAALYPPAEGAFFPPYCSGTGYVLAGAALPALLAAARRVPLVPVEDVFVGLCARHAGLAPRHLPRMAGAAHFPLDGCCYREVLFSVHRVAPRLMEAAWEAAAPGQPACSAWQRALGLLRCRALGWLWERSGGQEEQEAEAGA